MSVTEVQRCLPPGVTAWRGHGLGADRRSREQATGERAPSALPAGLSSPFLCEVEAARPLHGLPAGGEGGRPRDAGRSLSFPHSVLTGSCESVRGTFSVFKARALPPWWLSTLAARDSGRGGHRGFASSLGFWRTGRARAPAPLGPIAVLCVGRRRPRCTGEGHEAQPQRGCQGHTVGPHGSCRVEGVVSADEAFILSRDEARRALSAACGLVAARPEQRAPGRRAGRCWASRAAAGVQGRVDGVQGLGPESEVTRPGASGPVWSRPAV